MFVYMSACVWVCVNIHLRVGRRYVLRSPASLFVCMCMSVFEWSVMQQTNKHLLAARANELSSYCIIIRPQCSSIKANIFHLFVRMGVVLGPLIWAYCVVLVQLLPSTILFLFWLLQIYSEPQTLISGQGAKDQDWEGVVTFLAVF